MISSFFDLHVVTLISDVQRRGSQIPLGKLYLPRRKSLHALNANDNLRVAFNATRNHLVEILVSMKY